MGLRLKKGITATRISKDEGYLVMHFHFTMLNHDEIGKKTLFDMYYWFRASLEELGHTVTFSDHLNPFAINAIWENFSVESGSALAESGLQYGIVATEIPVNETFNNRSDGLWGRRWAGFLAAAKNALFIWSMVDKAIAVYEKMAPACFIELGFTQALVPAWVNCKVKFKYDFCFLGNITEYRRNMLKRLEKEASVFYSNDFFSWGKMGEVFKMCKIGLALRLSEDWPIPSPTRIGRLLHKNKYFAIPLKLGAIRLEDQNLEMLHPHIIHGNKLKVLANLYWITKHTKQ